MFKINSLVIYPSFIKLNIYNRKFPLFASVSPGPAGGKPIPNKIIISPSVIDGEIQEKLIIQNFNAIQLGDIKKIGIYGTQDLSENHAQMVELLSYALVLSGNHVFTSGTSGGGIIGLKNANSNNIQDFSGLIDENNSNNESKYKFSTNLSVIKGALRACNPDLLTVILPQSLARQPYDMQVLLGRVANLIQNPQNDEMDFKDAANLCNLKILSYVDKVMVFVYHDSTTILSSLEDIGENVEVIKFYLD
eukprot:gene8281-11210_t